MRVVVGVAETSNKICRYVFERRGVCETVWGTDGVFQLLQFAPETVVAHWVLQRFLCFSMKRHFYVIMHYAVFGIVMKQESEKLWNKKHTIESETLFAEQNYGSDTDQMSWFVSRSRSTARLLWSMVNQYASHSIFRLQGHFMSLPMLLCSYECHFMFFFQCKIFFIYIFLRFKNFLKKINETDWPNTQESFKAPCIVCATTQSERILSLFVLEGLLNFESHDDRNCARFQCHLASLEKLRG